MGHNPEDVAARLDALLLGQQAVQATLDEISKCILKAPRAPQFDLTIYNGTHEDRTRVTEGGEGSARQDILAAGAAEALRKQVSAVEAAVAELRLLKVDLQAAQASATRAWEPSAEASPSRAEISTYGEHVTRKELVHAVEVLRDELRGARMTFGTTQVPPAEIAQLQKELMAAVQASVERLGTELKDSSGRELASLASRTMLMEKQAVDVGEVVAMLQREVAGLRGIEPGLTHKEVEQLVGTLIDADVKRRAAAEEENGPVSVFDIRTLAVENTALRARLAAQLELTEVHAAGGKVGEWRVVFSRGVANVRRTKEYDAEILGTKRHGEVCVGSQEGEWLALAGEPGFVRIFGRLSGERILEPCDPALEVNLEGPAQLAGQPKELQRRPAVEPVSETFLPSAEKLGEEMRHELLTLWRAVAELADMRCVPLPSRVASEPSRESVVEHATPLPVRVVEVEPRVEPEEGYVAPAGCDLTSTVHAPPSAQQQKTDFEDLPPPPLASTAVLAPEPSPSRPAEPEDEDLPPPPLASTAVLASEPSGSRPTEPKAEDVPPPPLASIAVLAPEPSPSRPAEPEDEDWKRRGSYVEGGIEITPEPSEELEVKSEARAHMTTSRSVTFEEVEGERAADSDAVGREYRDHDAHGTAGMLPTAQPGDSERVDSAATRVEEEGPAELEAAPAQAAGLEEVAYTSQPQEAPASSARARRTSLADVATKRRGSRVVVLQDFPSDSADAAPLKRSLHGVVKEIDAEGDVLIEFADGTAQWVFEDNFDKLGLIDSDEVVRSKKSKAAGIRKTATMIALRVGREVIVREAFQSDSEERIVLSKGLKGIVRNIDEDGDALIEFEGLDKPQWIFKVAFDKLANPEDDADKVSDDTSDSVASKTDDEAQLKPIEKGEVLYYNSVSQGGWIRCKAVAVRKADGAVQVDVKNGYWFTAKDQTEKLRRKGQPLYWVGQALQYKSVTLGKWTDCEAMAVREDGAIQIDAKGDTWLTVEEQLEKIRMRAMQAGLLVSVARDFESDSEKKRPLRQGTRGIIKEVDEEGDALVVFDDVPNTPEWIFKGNFDKLRLVRAQRPDVPNTAVPSAMEEQTSEVSKPSEADAGAGVGQVVGLHVGAKVTVVEDFKADSEEQTMLRCGQRGVVKQIDNEGDALIDFEAHQQCQWVYRPNFGKLKMAKPEAPKAVEADITAMDVKQLKDFIASAGLSFVDCFAKKDLVVRAGEAQAKLREGR